MSQSLRNDLPANRAALAFLGVALSAAIIFSGVASAANGVITRLSTGSLTEQQNSPAISGNLVVWTDALTPPGGASNFDIFLLDLATGFPPLTLPHPPNSQ